ncbi:uncharacterized protein LOC127261334 [Andrographis paniculata]|uniref:uncharacterized protein LOC127261334 n=1 Tax=Andrographis paniculata TaxID=175694 RepID=UPI0021E7D4CB|nr:uncharacterized protein LOC127261334 [Andrographis paniculata]
MGDTSSTSSKNPSSTATMDPSNSLHPTGSIDHPKSPESKFGDPPADAEISRTLENPAKEMDSEGSNRGAAGDEGGEGEEEEEEEGECGFCLFMKGGGCKDAFIEWEKCVEEGEQNKEDIVEKCFQATAALKKCMEAHSDYYAPLLQAEKAAEEEAVKQLEEEKERLNNQEKGSEASDVSEKKESS